MRTVALVCARGGSKGLPGKNSRQLAGRPLIARAVETAKAVPRVDSVVVSTDSPELAAIARDAGALVPFMRPENLAQDDSPEWLVWRHAIDFLMSDGGGRVDALLVVPPTAPLRHIEDLDRCLDEFGKGDVDVVITVTDAHRNPFFNMVRVRNDGTSVPVLDPTDLVSRRQDAPAVFDMTTVAYVARPDFVMGHDSLFSGRVRQVYVPPERAIDIDTPLDFKIAECLLEDQSS